MANTLQSYRTAKVSAESVREELDTVHQNLIDKVHALDLEVKAVSVGLKNKIQETECLRKQRDRLLDSLPIGALLIHQDGHVVYMNQSSKALLGPDSPLQEGQPVDRAWRKMNFPPTPFDEFPYHGQRLNCWEETLGTSGTYPCLKVRFISSGKHVVQQPGGSDGHRLKAMAEKVGKIFHDVRNALMSIELFASLLERKSGRPYELQRLATNLLQSVRMLVQFVNNAETFVGSHNTQMEFINVHEVLKQVELLATPSLKARHITLRRLVAPEAETIEADRVLLQRACLNILLNAVSASPQGGIIDIDCQKNPSSFTEENGEFFICIRVKDHGCGIKNKDLPNVCTPFYTTRKGGKGLGLAIVHDVMNAHQGTIDIRSQEGQGTTVSLSFPQQRRPA